jgi:hypothetical protein
VILCRKHPWTKNTILASPASIKLNQRERKRKIEEKIKEKKKDIYEIRV